MQGAEPTYCMGDDVPLPVLSSRPHPLADYFKQRFAQVHDHFNHTCCVAIAYSLQARILSKFWNSDGIFLGTCWERGGPVRLLRAVVHLRPSCDVLRICITARVPSTLRNLQPGLEGIAMQVTNPPIDPLREGLVMSLEMRLGKRGNLLTAGPDSYAQVCSLAAGFGTSTLLCYVLLRHVLPFDTFARLRSGDSPRRHLR